MRVIEFLQDIGKGFLNILTEVWGWFPLVPRSQYEKVLKERDEIKKSKSDLLDAVIDHLKGDSDGETD